MDWTVPGQVGAGAPQPGTTYDMSVVDQQGAKYCNGGHVKIAQDHKVGLQNPDSKKS